MEEDGGENEEAKRNDLNEQANEDNRLSNVGIYILVGLEAGTAGLDQERQNVGDDENLCEPSNPNYGVVLGLYTADDPPENHVNGSGEECRRNKNDNCLYAVGNQSARVVCRPDSCKIADCLNFGVVVSNETSTMDR